MSEAPKLDPLVIRYQLLLAANVDARASKADVAVLAVILGRMQKDQDRTWPSLDTIASDACVDRRTASRAVGRLVEWGYLQRESGKSHIANVYLPGVPLASHTSDMGGDSIEADFRGEQAPEFRGDDAPEYRGASVHASGAPVSTSGASVTASGAPVSPNSGAAMPPELKAEKQNQEQEQEKKKTRAMKPRAAVVVPVAPDWLDSKAWAEWVDYRSKLRGFTERALELCLKTIDRHRQSGHDPVRLIELAIERGWTGIYPSDATIADGQAATSGTGRAIRALQRTKGTGNVTQDFEAVWAGQSRPQAGMLPRDPRSEEEQLEAMIAGSIDPEATRALLRAAIEEEQAG